MTFKMKELNHRIMLKNGVTLSVQASAFHYCEPQTDDLEYWEDYESVEVGFILDKAEKKVKPPPSWVLYAPNQELPSDIYAYVPVSLVKDFIAYNGGFKKFVVEPPSLFRKWVSTLGTDEKVDFTDE